MKRTSLFLALAFSLALPTFAQQAPAGWTAKTKANGAKTFTPLDLRKGETYSVTLYNPMALNGKTPEAWLRAFAGTVGNASGQLVAPLQILKTDGDVTSFKGAYRGPNGSQLGVVFFAVSPGNGQISVERLLFSGAGELVIRFQNETQEIMKAFTDGTKREAGVEPVVVPEAIFDSMKRGGAFVPGIYVGKRVSSGGSTSELSIDLYANGEYRILHTENGKILAGYKVAVGEYDYEARSGKINIGSSRDLTNRVSVFGNRYCFFGRDAAGKPWIYAEDEGTITTLFYIGPPTKRLSPRAESVREAAIEAEKNRYKWVVKPGKGVQSAQIEAVWWNQTVHSDGLNNSVSSETYLLLRDGTVRDGLPVALDEMDILKSRQKEPDRWGKWRRKGRGYEVSWHGGAWEPLKGFPAVPGGAGTRFNARYEGSRSSYHGTGSSFSFWGVTFGITGRFSKDSSSNSSSTIGVGEGSVVVQSGHNNGQSYGGALGGGVAVGSIQKNNANGDREGTYAINGYTLTLRYDNGKVERQPFFFNGKDRAQVWFEGDLLRK